jgi:hypothetical protein
MKWCIAAIILMLAPSSANALTGNELLTHCGVVERYDAGVALSEGDVSDATICVHYIAGVFDMLSLYAEANQRFCPRVPAFLPPKQQVLIVMKHLRDHPEQLHHAAIGQVFSAIAKAYPCAS